MGSVTIYRSGSPPPSLEEAGRRLEELRTQIEGITNDLRQAETLSSSGAGRPDHQAWSRRAADARDWRLREEAYIVNWVKNNDPEELARREGERGRRRLEARARAEAERQVGIRNREERARRHAERCARAAQSVGIELNDSDSVIIGAFRLLRSLTKRVEFSESDYAVTTAVQEHLRLKGILV
ncbi:MAG: hypothetical protein AAB554_00670 [Patescibacteria group bacterium]